MQHRHLARRIAARFIRVILPGSAILFSPSIFAVTYNFIPGAGTASPDPSGTANWNDFNNWVTGSTSLVFAVPTAADQASSSTSATTIVNSDVPAVNEIRFANNAPGTSLNGGAYTATSFATLEIDSGAVLTSLSANGTNSGDIQIGNAQPSAGTLIVNGGVVTMGVAGGHTPTGDGSNPTLFQSLTIANATGANGAPTATLLMSDGTVNVGNNFVVGYGADFSNGPHIATGFGNQSGGSITVGGAIIIGARGVGSYAISGGVLIQAGTNPNQNSLGRDAFYLGQTNTGATTGGTGTFTQSGTASVSIANGLYIANQSFTSGAYTISGGTLTIAGDLSVGAATGAGVQAAAPAAATNNVGLFQIVGHSAATITANHITANTSNSTIGYTIDSSSGPTLLSLTAATVGGVSYDGSAQLGGGFIDIDPANAFTPAPGDVYELIRAVSIPNLPTLVVDGDAFDTSTLSIRDNGNGTFSLIDTVPVPEPTGLALIALPAMMIALKRRRTLRNVAA